MRGEGGECVKCPKSEGIGDMRRVGMGGGERKKGKAMRKGMREYRVRE